MLRRVAYSGNIKTIPLPETICFLAQQKETGTLYLRRDQVIKAVQFSKGRPVFVASSLARESFIRTCVLHEQVAVMAAVGLADEALDKQLFPEQIAIKQRIFSEKTVQSIIEEVQLARFMELFYWRHGEFLFDFRVSIKEDEIVCFPDRSLNDLVATGIRQSMGAGHIRSRLRDKMELVPEIVWLPDSEDDQFKLQPGELRLVRMIDGRSTLEEIVNESTSSLKETLKLFYVLDILGCVKLVDYDRAVSPRHLAKNSFDDYTFEVIEFSDQVEKDYDRLMNGNFFTLFNLTRQFDENTLRRNYYSLAQKYRPEDHYRNAAPQLRYKADDIFQRLSSGYEALLDWLRFIDSGRQEEFREQSRQLREGRMQRIRAERDFLHGKDLMELGQQHQAHASITEAARLRDVEGEYWAYIGYLNYKLAQGPSGKEQALVQLKRAQANDSNCVEAYQFLAEIHEELKRLDLALDLMKKAARLRPESKLLRHQVRRLAKFANPKSGAKPLVSERAAIEKRMQHFLDRTQDSDLYQMLDLAPDATNEQIRRSYFRLAKEFHPDRLTNISPEFARHPMAELIFQKINEAYEVLSHSMRRTAYDRGIDLKTQEDQIRKTLVKKKIDDLQRRGETAVKEGNLKVALQAFEQVVEADPEKAVAQAYLVYVQFCLDAQKIDNFQVYDDKFKALVEHRRNRDTIYLLWGKMYKRVDQPEQAITKFKKAVEFNPNCVDALREVRITNSRHGDMVRENSKSVKQELMSLFNKKVNK